MIKTITVTNDRGNSLVLSMSNPFENGMIIQKIDGLGPVKATINTTEITSSDGAIFNSARQSYRNIVLTLQYIMAAGFTVEEIRLRSYEFFQIKKQITLTIETDSRTVTIDGYVESNEPDIFSNNESAQISIICPDPDFYDAEKNGPGIASFTNVEAGFHFEFESEDYKEGSAVDNPENFIEFGSVGSTNAQNVYYEGDNPLGFTIQLFFNDSATQIYVYNMGTHEYIHIDTIKIRTVTGKGLSVGDIITINTRKGHKSAVLNREGVKYSVLSCLDKHTTWFELVKGDNEYMYHAETGEENILMTISYDTAYEGV